VQVAVVAELIKQAHSVKAVLVVAEMQIQMQMVLLEHKTQVAVVAVLQLLVQLGLV
jgi:hypothetical protein